MPKRVNSTVDVARLAQAVSRPGIDTRIWCCLGYAMKDAVLDAEHGWMVDARMLPSGMETTLRIPQSNAGSGFGASEGPILKDDELAAVFPDGDPAAGGFVIARSWSASDVPPDLAVQNSADIVRVLKKDTSYRVKLTGTGIIRMEAEDKAYLAGSTVTLESSNVRLGAENATEQYVLGTTFRSNLSTLDTAASTALTTLAGALIGAGASLVAVALDVTFVAAFPAVSALISAAGTALTTGGTALNAWITAIAAFNAQAPTHLSNVTKGK